MAEYIEREAAYEKCGWYNTVNGKSVYAVRKDELAAIPAVDVEPVRHGRWVITKEYNDVLGINTVKYTCSACKEYRLSVGDFSQATDYCPNCGARMDLEVSE